MNNLTSLFLALAAFLLSPGMNPASANIDPAPEWSIVKIAPGVYAHPYAAEAISVLSPTQIQEVIDLFHTYQPPMKGYGFTTATNDCYTLQILTEKSFEDFGIEEANFPDMKTAKGISLLEFFSIKKACRNSNTAPERSTQCKNFNFQPPPWLNV